MSLLTSIGITTVTKSATTIATLSTNSIITSISLSNTHYGSVPVSIWIERGATTIYLGSNVSIPSNDSLEFIKTSKISLLENDIIKISAKVSGVVTGILTLYGDV